MGFDLRVAHVETFIRVGMLGIPVCFHAHHTFQPSNRLCGTLLNAFTESSRMTDLLLAIEAFARSRVVVITRMHFPYSKWKRVNAFCMCHLLIRNNSGMFLKLRCSKFTKTQDVFIYIDHRSLHTYCSVKYLINFGCIVFTDEDVNNLPEPKRIFLDDASKKLCNFVITKDKVCNKLGQLKGYKAPGPDRLSPKLLKKIKMEISKPLCLIFNRSLQDSSVPED